MGGLQRVCDLAERKAVRRVKKVFEYQTKGNI
jgi:hypothetical protein